MGAGNVSAAYAVWSHRLKDRHRAFRVLVYMANGSKDGDSPPRFWAGRDALVLALGRRPHTKAQQHAAYEAVRAAVDELVTAGAIECTGRPRPGRNAEYSLHLWTSAPTQQAKPVATAQGEPVPARRVSLPSLQAEPARAQGEPVPEEEQEEQELEEQQQPSATSATSRLVDRARAQAKRSA